MGYSAPPAQCQQLQRDWADSFSDKPTRIEGLALFAFESGAILCWRREISGCDMLKLRDPLRV